MTHLPSVSRRLALTLLVMALASSLAASAAVWLAVRHEVSELLDDTLRSAAEAMRPHLLQAPAIVPASAGTADARFAWQVVQQDADGTPRVLQASSDAPRSALCEAPCPGFGDRPGWRVFGSAVGQGGRMLYVAQSREEQSEAILEIVMAAALATLAVGLLSYVWLRFRVQVELAPLIRLSARLERHDLLAPGATLGPAERSELQPVHEAIDGLAAQLAARLANEQAFSAHAAHALRTPLAGMDAQLAVALREAPVELRPRLERVRAASGRLKRVVAALLALFRSGEALRLQDVSLERLLERLPVDGLDVQARPGDSVQADGDLLAAALLNLLDNSLRHGARSVRVAVVSPGVVEVSDDGPGVDAARRALLREALLSPDPSSAPGAPGLGLVLAQRVARAHGGALELTDSEQGFVVRLNLNPAAPINPSMDR